MANAPAKRETGNVGVREGFLEFLLRRIEEDKEAGGAYEFSMSLVDNILVSGTLEEMWDADDYEGTAGKDLEDVEMNILSIIFRESDRFESGILLPNGNRAFVLVRSARLDTGEEFVWNTGSSGLIAKLRWLEAADYFGKPEANCVIRGRDAGEGRVLKLKPVPVRAVQGKAE